MIDAFSLAFLNISRRGNLKELIAFHKGNYDYICIFNIFVLQISALIIIWHFSKLDEFFFVVNPNILSILTTSLSMHTMLWILFCDNNTWDCIKNYVFSWWDGVMPLQPSLTIFFSFIYHFSIHLMCDDSWI